MEYAIYRSPLGKRCGHYHTPDFLVIAEDGIAFVECKTESELIKLEVANPGRYYRDENGHWRCPPGEAAAAEYGLGYRVHSAASVDTRFVRNTEFIYDYIHGEPAEELLPTIEEIADHIQQTRFERLDRLHEKFPDSDAIYWAIAQQAVYFNFHTDLLARPENAFVYADRTYDQAIKCFSTSAPKVCNSAIRIKAGSEILWDNQPWQVLNVGNGEYTLRQREKLLATLTEQQIGELVRDGKIKIAGVSQPSSPALAHLLKASPQDLKTANSRVAEIDKYRTGICTNVPDRTLRYWQKKANDAEQCFGNRYLGLISKIPSRGNRTIKILANQIEPLQKSIEEHYLTITSRSYKAAFNNYVTQNEESGIPLVSYPTYRNWCKAITDKVRVLKREGKKSAYQLGPDHKSDSDFPPHGDRAFEVAHIDHTPPEIELISEITGESLGLAWLTLLIDAFSRVVLGHFLTFEKPSVRSLMMVLRDCVRRHGRLPRNIVVDRGAEFGSIYFEAFCAMYGVNIFNRPPAEPRFGAPVERNFGSTQTVLVHDLVGNTKNLHLGRSLSASHHPIKDAVWTPDAFNERLEDWLYSVYPHLPHTGVIEHPADRFERSLAASGAREHTFIRFDQMFILSTLPSPETGTRVLRRGSITLNHMPYTAAEAISARCDGSKVEVRYDPYNALYIYAYVDDRWLRFKNSWSLLREYSERDITLVHMEVMARAHRTNKEYREVPDLLRRFVRDNRQREQVLLSQRNINQMPKVSVEVDCDELDDISVIERDTANIQTTVEFITL
jgi:transposase InsO family protein